MCCVSLTFSICWKQRPYPPLDKSWSVAELFCIVTTENEKKMCMVKCPESACSHRQSTRQNISIFHCRTFAKWNTMFGLQIDTQTQKKRRTKLLLNGKNKFWTVTTNTIVVVCMCMCIKRSRWCITKTMVENEKVYTDYNDSSCLFSLVRMLLKFISITSRYFPQFIFMQKIKQENIPKNHNFHREM